MIMERRTQLPIESKSLLWFLELSIYAFKVSAISQSGRGENVVIDAQTQPSTGTGIHVHVSFYGCGNFLTPYV